ncbi:MAG: hypothetical protein LBI19_00110 [Oscillospiraceae bacterium]|jgi:hypothetical protein|nr:hypothetical protein [Oscillospiraceae bacterium]
MGLFKPAWQSKNIEKAIRAVKKITDQTMLAEIGKTAEYGVVRFAAIEMITDQVILADIAKKKHNSSHTRIMVAEKLTDKAIADTVFADIVINDNSRDNTSQKKRFELVKKLTDQLSIANVAKNAIDIAVREAAIHKLTDQSTLTHITINEQNNGLRKEALLRITNHIMLVDIAKNSKDDYIRISATQKLVDQDLAQTIYTDIAKNSREDYLRQSAIRKLIDQSVIADIAKHEETEDVRYTAVDVLTSQSVLTDIIKHDKSSSIRVMACKKLGTHSMNPYKQCRLKCDACSVVDYDHEYAKTYHGLGSFIGHGYYSGKCTKCGHSFNENEGSHAEGGYYIE